MGKKELVQKYRPLVSFACGLHNLRNVFRIKGRSGNTLEAPCALLRRVRIHFSGSGNRVVVGDFSILTDVELYISGNNNTIVIGPWCHVNRATICTEDNGNTISLGAHTRIMGQTELAAIEGTAVTIGEDCLFSSGICVRTGDSHSVLNLEGKRINPSQSVTIGNHVWMGIKTICLKGASVADHCIVGAGAIVTKKFTTPNCALAGNPARVVREGVDWDLSRIPME